ncbi:MAG TPA: ABC transporter substrate-binding protein [Thermomicrobiales bacterium]|nr:ABC transporter substrate-binding protein [Thermomicrobiales bacterium]
MLSDIPLESLSDMPDAIEGPTPPAPPATPAALTADAFSRRTLMASVIGGVSAVAIAGRFAGALRGPSKPQLAQTGSTGQSSIGAGTPSPLAASPAASPVASPSATATATVTPSPTPVPDPFGDIEVLTGERWEYEGDPKASKTLTLFVQGAEANLDFSPASYVQDAQITTSYLDPLVGIDKATMEPVPWLAEQWIWSDGNQTVTFSLRGDVTWHDGRKCTADDVAFSFTVYRDDIDSAVRNFFTTMDSVEAVDDRTLKVNLTAPDGNWILNASSLPIFSEHQYGDYWNGQPEGERTLTGFDWEKSTPVGTGPWKVTEQKSDAVVMAPNEDYWQESPAFTKLVLRFTESQDDRIARWVDGDGDLLWPVSPLDIPALKDTEARLYASNGAQVAFAAFNFENLAREQFPQMLTDTRVREALNLAIDRDRYATETYLGLIDQSAAGTVAQPWAYDPSVTNPGRDVAKAKKLLADAGFHDVDGDGLLDDPTGNPFTLTAIVRSDANPILIALLNGLVEDFAEIGATLAVDQLAPADFFDTWASARAWDLIAYSYALYPGFTDYDLYGSNWDIRINPQGWNPGGYDNDDVDDLLKKILISPNLNSQAGLLTRLQETVNGEDLFGLWFGFPNDLVLARMDIQGFQPNKYLPAIDARLLWRDDKGSGPSTPPPPATPQASPVASPLGTPSAATPVPLASPSPSA